MRKYEGDKLIEIICNKCGISEDVFGDEHGHRAEPFREIDFTYGYGSELYDFNGVRFDLCEYCVRDIIETFKIPAESREYRIAQGYNSDGHPFVYYERLDEAPPTQEKLDEMYMRLTEKEADK